MQRHCIPQVNIQLQLKLRDTYYLRNWCHIIFLYIFGFVPYYAKLIKYLYQTIVNTNVEDITLFYMEPVSQQL